MKHSLI